MADQKISQLPAATLPLSGTELILLVQSGTTSNAPASAFSKAAPSSVAATLAAGNNENYQPPGWTPGVTNRLVLTGGAASVLGGLYTNSGAIPDGFTVSILNVGNGFQIAHEDAGTVSGDQFVCAGGVNGYLAQYSGVIATYIHNLIASINYWILQ